MAAEHFKGNPFLFGPKVPETGPPWTAEQAAGYFGDGPVVAEPPGEPDPDEPEFCRICRAAGYAAGVSVATAQLAPLVERMTVQHVDSIALMTEKFCAGVLELGQNYIRAVEPWAGAVAHITGVARRVVAIATLAAAAGGAAIAIAVIRLLFG